MVALFAVGSHSSLSRILFFLADISISNTGHLLSIGLCSQCDGLEVSSHMCTCSFLSSSFTSAHLCFCLRTSAWAHVFPFPRGQHLKSPVLYGGKLCPPLSPKNMFISGLPWDPFSLSLELSADGYFNSVLYRHHGTVTSLP